jgi:hypothetical protein
LQNCVNDLDFVRQGIRVAPAVSFEEGIRNNFFLFIIDLGAHAAVGSAFNEVFTSGAG